jgi:hypothetical protein
MRWLAGLVALLSVGSLSSASSSGATATGDAGDETVAKVSEAITAACSLDTIGLPCDPDGPAGTKLECEGACGIALSGLVACQPVVAGALNGRGLWDNEWYRRRRVHALLQWQDLSS